MAGGLRALVEAIRNASSGEADPVAARRLGLAERPVDPLHRRAAIFADCGLGKTPMELVWAENIARKTGGNVLILTPLAVSHQAVHEAQKFGIDAQRSADGAAHRITIANYERLHYFNPSDFAGVVCDESSILKSFDGKRRGEITVFMRKMQYRLLATATAAPNDYIELGTSSEALGYLGHMDMLLGMIAAGRLDPAPMFTETVAFDAIETAIADVAARKPGLVKPLVTVG